MTPLPKRKLSTRRQGKRRAAIGMSFAIPVKCLNCGGLRLPHRVCPSCGFYDGKPMVIKKEKKKKTT